MSHPSPERETFLQRAADWVFGYDFFISYSHRDGLNYPRQLKQRLEQRGFKVFLDQTEYVPGLDLHRETSRQVRKSRKIVIIGRPAAFQSKWVKREVDIAIARRMIPLVININGAVEAAGPEAIVAALARERHWLRLNEAIDAPDSDPSAFAVDELVRGYSHTRQETKRLRVLAGAAVVFAFLARGASVAALEAYRQKTVAERNFAVARQSADGLVFDIARGLRDVAGLRADSVHRILGRADAALTKLIASDPENTELQRSRAAMLGEFSVTYLTVGDIDAGAEAAGKAVALLEGLAAQRRGSGDAIQRDLALNLVRLADAATEKGDLATARSRHKRALEIRRALVASNADDLEDARNVTTSLMRIGEIEETAGELSEAARLFEQALKLRRPLAQARPEWRRDLTVGYVKLGDVKLTLGDLAGAAEAFESAIAIARQLAREDRTSTRWQRDLAVALQRLGNQGIKAGNAARAASSYSECLSIFQDLSRSDPSNLEWKSDIAITRFKLGEAAILGGEVALAAQYLNDALADRRELLKTSPENHQVLTDIAENLMVIARVSAPAERQGLMREARAILTDLKRRGRTGIEQERWLLAIDAEYPTAR